MISQTAFLLNSSLFSEVSKSNTSSSKSKKRIDVFIHGDDTKLFELLHHVPKTLFSLITYINHTFLTASLEAPK